MRFGLVFLACPLKLDDEQRQQLMLAAVQAYYQQAGESDLDWPELRGTLRAMRDTVTLGGFSGQLFEADVHTPTGEQGQLRFLVADKELLAGGPVAEA